MHPGGAEICNGMSRDASDTFHTFHPKEVMEHELPRWCIGFLRP